MAGCSGAENVIDWITQHHLHGGADDGGIADDDMAVAGALQRLSERCAALGAGGNGHGGGEWMGAGWAPAGHK